MVEPHERMVAMAMQVVLVILHKAPVLNMNVKQQAAAAVVMKMILVVMEVPAVEVELEIPVSQQEIYQLLEQELMDMMVGGEVILLAEAVVLVLLVDQGQFFTLSTAAIHIILVAEEDKII